MVQLHPDKLISLQKIVRQRRQSRTGVRTRAPRRSYVRKPAQQEGSSMLRNLAYRLHDRRFSEHYARLAQEQPPAPGNGR